MLDCLMPVFFGALVIVVFGIWLWKQGDAVFEKAIVHADQRSWVGEMNAFVANWEKETGQNFDTQSLIQKKIILGEWAIQMIEVYHVKR